MTTTIRAVDAYIRANPNCTTRAIADGLRITSRAVGHALEALEENNNVIRVEPTKDHKRNRWIPGPETTLKSRARKYKPKYVPKGKGWFQSPKDGTPHQVIVTAWKPPQVAQQSWLSALGIDPAQESA